MRALKQISIFLLFVLGLSNFCYSQTVTYVKKPLRKQFPQFMLSPYGGAIFPLPKIMNENFKPGGNFGIDAAYRVNREVALYGKFSYFFMSSKITGAPVGSYMEFSAGPRYYFTHPKLNSELFFEGGVGAYNFRQKSYVNPGDSTGATISQINNTRPGINGGIGATLGLSKAIDILVKSDYHVIFTPNGSTSFLTVGAGFDFRFR